MEEGNGEERGGVSCCLKTSKRGLIPIGWRNTSRAMVTWFGLDMAWVPNDDNIYIYKGHL